MKKAFISALFIISFGAYILYAQNQTVASASTTTPTAATTAVATSQPIATTQSTQTTPVTQTTSQTSGQTTTTKPTTKTSTGAYLDGTYTGSVADAYYGNIQVRATISGGKLTDVTFLQYPNDRGTSVEINQRAMPELRSEAIRAQSANVSGVSGASDSSAAFTQSLASALTQAKA